MVSPQLSKLFDAFFGRSLDIDKVGLDERVVRRRRTLVFLEFRYFFGLALERWVRRGTLVEGLFICCRERPVHRRYGFAPGADLKPLQGRELFRFDKEERVGTDAEALICSAHHLYEW